MKFEFKHYHTATLNDVICYIVHYCVVLNIINLRRCITVELYTSSG